MAIVTKTGKQSTGIGALMLAHLEKVGQATTEELAAAAKCERKEASARLWWLMAREGRVVATGEGKERVWSLPKTAENEKEKKQEKKAAPKKEPAKKRSSAKKASSKKATAKKAVKK